MTKMEESKRRELIENIADFIGMIGIYLPDDVEQAIQKLAADETEARAQTMYGCILEDLKLAAELKRPLCQDTGLLQFFLDVGTDFPYAGEMKEILEEATAKATAEVPLRPNVVQPLGEKNTGNNVGYEAPCIEYELIPGSSELRLRAYMAGGGCSLPGRSKVLMPLEGIQGIREFICNTVVDWGVNACPPLCIGVGLGTCAATSAMLSKKALLRPIGTKSEYPEVAALEEQLLEDLNALGIGPLGFGGSASVMSVNIEAMGHHPATLGVGLTTGCWATRRGEMIIGEDLSCRITSHDSQRIHRG